MGSTSCCMKGNTFQHDQEIEKKNDQNQLNMLIY